MHHLHEHTLPCYHQSLHNVLKQLRNSDLQIATRIFLRQGYYLKTTGRAFFFKCTMKLRLRSSCMQKHSFDFIFNIQRVCVHYVL